MPLPALAPLAHQATLFCYIVVQVEEYKFRGYRKKKLVVKVKWETKIYASRSYGIAVPSSHGNMGTLCKMASCVPFCQFKASVCNWEGIEKPSRIIPPNSASLKGWNLVDSIFLAQWFHFQNSSRTYSSAKRKFLPYVEVLHSIINN